MCGPTGTRERKSLFLPGIQENPCHAPNLTRRSPAAAALAFATVPRARAANPDAITIDWAIYNRVSLVLRQERLLERAFAPDKIEIRWVQSQGSKRRWSSSTRARSISVRPLVPPH